MQRSSYHTRLTAALMLFICLNYTSLYAQLSNHGRIWHFGFESGLDFSTDPPTPLTGIPMHSFEGCATYCDADGKLLFYTNGGGEPANFPAGAHQGVIWNSQYDVLYNIPLNEGGCYTSAQSSLFLPKPGSADQYYLLTMDHFGSVNQPNNRGLSYFLIDKNGNGGLGSVTAASVPVYKPAAESLSATRHANGKDFWVCVVDSAYGDWVVMPLTESGFGAPQFYPRGEHDASIVTKMSPDGNFLCTDEELYRFDPATGQVTFLHHLPMSAYTFSFSASSRYLYALESDTTSLGRFVRFDMTAADIPGSRRVFNSTNLVILNGFMQIGPDGSLYVTEQTVDDFLGFPATASLSRIQCADSDEPEITRTWHTFPTDPSNPVGGHTSLANFADYIFASSTSNDTAQVTTICGPEGALLTAPAGAQYQWSTGDTTGAVTVHQQGEYRVTVTQGCNQATRLFRVEEHTATVAIESASIADTCAALPLLLRAVGPADAQYSWSTGATTDTLRIEAFGTYTVTASTGCGAVTAEWSLDFDNSACCKPHIPNVFTPNGDDINDTFGLLSKGCAVETVALTIFSRWGAPVFQGREPGKGWDGRFDTGSDAPSDVYIYKIEYQIAGQAPVHAEGSVTLIR